jgi:Holliday junction resolvase RusA-like endonuclease
MLGYTKEDLDNMINSVHDAKLFYMMNDEDEYVAKSPMVAGLLMTNDFLQGLWAEGYFD